MSHLSRRPTGARQRDTSKQWDSSDEPFFRDWSEVEVVYQVVDLW